MPKGGKLLNLRNSSGEGIPLSAAGSDLKFRSSEMKTRVLVLFLALCGLFLAGQPLSAGEPGPVVVIPVQTEISPAQFLFLRRAIKDAERRQARALVLEMDTLGGDVSAALDSMDALLKTRVPTYTFINHKALSAGAMMALATGKIYMEPTAVIGAAAPVQAGGENLPSTMADKVVSSLSALARAAAERNGHNPEIADAFILKEKELKVGGVVVDGPGTLLTLSAQEAARVYEGRPLLAAGVAGSLREMLEQAGLGGAAVERVSPGGFEQVAVWITKLAPLLLLAGLLCGYIEIKTPGFGLPGFVSLICFALFFGGHYLAGLTGWGAAVVFCVGLALVVSELFLHPGTVLPGLAGALLIVGSLMWAMVDRYPGGPLWPDEDQLWVPVLKLGGTLAVSAVLMALLARVLPKTSLYRHVALVSALPAGEEAARPAANRAVQAGWTGVATTTLRPSGKAEFGGEVFDVVADGEFIGAGQPVRVALVEGARVVVHPA